MRDGTNLTAAVALAAADYAADAAGLIVDRLNFNRLTFLLAVGVGGITFTPANRVDFVLEHGDAPDGSDMAAVGADNVVGASVATGGIVSTLNAAHPAATVAKIGYVGGVVGEKRYVRLRPDFSGTHGTPTPLSAVAILAEPRRSA